MSKSSSSSGSGSLVLGLLGILFVGLKLTGFIDWSWWWVTAPFWGVRYSRQMTDADAVAAQVKKYR